MSFLQKRFCCNVQIERAKTKPATVTVRTEYNSWLGVSSLTWEPRVRPLWHHRRLILRTVVYVSKFSQVNDGLFFFHFWGVHGQDGEIVKWNDETMTKLLNNCRMAETQTYSFPHLKAAANLSRVLLISSSDSQKERKLSALNGLNCQRVSQNPWLDSDPAEKSKRIGWKVGWSGCGSSDSHLIKLVEWLHSN